MSTRNASTVGRTALGVASLMVVTSLMVVPPAASQEVVTLALVNGERPSGELMDLNAGGFVLRVAGENRSYPVNDVATVEFVIGPAASQAVAALNRGQAVVVLRDGAIIEGRLTDIGGTRPLRLTVDTASGSRDLRSSDVAQVHLRKTNQAAAGQASTPSAGQSIAVQANTPWTDTGVVVIRGDRVQFEATGDIMVAPQASAGVAGAEIKPLGRLPVPTASVGALIGRIGNGQPFPIGSTTQAITMPASGRLQLGVNDEHFDDNTGSFSVVIAKQPRS